MLKKGIINPQVNNALSKMTHLDTMLIADAGMPIPKGIERIDLAFTLGEPPLIPVVEGILDACIIEKVYMAEEMKSHSPDLFAQYGKLFGSLGIPVECLPHSEMLQSAQQIKVSIRTGENRYHYSSVILVCGCPY